LHLSRRPRCTQLAAVATVYPAYLNRPERCFEGTFTPTSYVVIGLAPGKTVLRIPGENPPRVVVVVVD